MTHERVDWTIVCFSGVDWEYSRQRPQWVMEALAERGAQVLFIDNLGIRFPRPSDARRVIRRMRRWLETSVQSNPQVRPGIRRDAPVVLPVDRPAALRSLMARLLVRRIRRRLGRRGPLVIWTYSPLPIISEAARALRADLLVYDWADDAAEHVLFSGSARRRRIARWEEEMARRAGVVLVSSRELLRRRGSPNPNTHLVPHGAPSAASRVGPAPAEVERLPRPRIGFVGTVSEWVDLDLLRQVATARPAWSFVIVGPQRARAEALRALPNVRMLGPRPHDVVLRVLPALDVALIPYRVVPAMASASPVKLHEYLAYGLPVVSTDLPEIREHAPPVAIASDAQGFVSAIERSLAEGPRTSPPRGTPWRQRVDEMVMLLSRALAERRGEG